MKVERKPAEPKFEPIVITLETKEEAEEMWHRFNCAPATSLVDYAKAAGIPEIRNAGAWRSLNRIFHP